MERLTTAQIDSYAERLPRIRRAVPGLRLDTYIEAAPFYEANLLVKLHLWRDRPPDFQHPCLRRRYVHLN